MVERIKKLCAARNISLRELEEATGIGKNSIYKWDSQSPSVKYVASVARYFAVSADYLISDDESAAQEQEASLIAKFRLLDDAQKSAVMILIDGFVKQAPIVKDAEIS